MRSLFFDLGFGASLASLLFFGVYYLSVKGIWKGLGRAALWVSWASATLFLAGRWQEAGRPPMSNMHESLMVMSWGLLGLFLVLERRLVVSGIGFWAAAANLAVVMNETGIPYSGYFSSHAVDGTSAALRQDFHDRTIALSLRHRPQSICLWSIAPGDTTGTRSNDYGMFDENFAARADVVSRYQALFGPAAARLAVR